METQTQQIGISEQVLNWINENTHRDNLKEKSTKEVALQFNMTTNAAYRLCNILADKRLITKLDPVNGKNFDCCGWIKNEDE
jgi:DNA-binding IclR family transcriptional regulator